MSDEDKIIKLLQEDGAPALGQDAAQRIAARAVVEFNQSRPRKAGIFSFFHGRAPVLAGAAFAAVAMLSVLLWQRPQEAAPLGRQDRERIVLAEFNELFGGWLQAVITVNGKTQVVLGENVVPRGQPVAIRLSENGQSVDIVSFSGQNVQVSFGGREMNFDALVDGNGGVILAGEKLFWRDGKTPDDGLTVEARALEM